jgi:Uma2 family endonuclease
MANARHTRTRKVEYPTGDGKPMAETEIHRDDMVDLIQTLERYFEAEPMICVSGNLLMFYEEGNPRKRIAPDVFVVRGVEKKLRENYLVWEEGKAPDVVIEVTSRSTRHEDQVRKLAIYRDVLRVTEYFMFDPREDYLDPPLQGFRLLDGEYLPIEPVDGRLASEVLDLHLERDGYEVRLYDPVRHARVLTTDELIREFRQLAKKAERLTEAAERRAGAPKGTAEMSLHELIAESERLREEIDALRLQLGSSQ